jgi:hypothetical protein
VNGALPVVFQSGNCTTDSVLMLPKILIATEPLKFLKRQMYGRAKLDLLRARVLHPN